MRTKKLLSVVAALIAVMVLAAFDGLDEGQVMPGLRNVAPEQVGGYALEVVDTEPNALSAELGAEENLESLYRTPDGEQIYFGLWAFPSAFEADQVKQGTIEGEQDQGYAPAETFSVDDAQGNRLGTGLVLESSESETVVWTDGSVLAVVNAPRAGYGTDFYRALYSERGGTSLTSGTSQAAVAPGTSQPLSPTTLITAMPVGILPLAAVLALLVSIGLLKLYRRAVLKSMSARANPPLAEPPEASAPAGQSGHATPDLSVLDHDSSVAGSPAAEALRLDLLSAPWRVAAIYAAAGACYALVLATTILAAGGTEFLPVRFLFLFWICAWPVVLTVNLAAASTRRAKLLTASAYFLVLAALDALVIARNPESSWIGVVGLWPLLNLPATVLLLASLNRRVRAVGPLVLTFMILALTGSFLTLAAAINSERLSGFFFELGWGIGLEAGSIFVIPPVLGLIAFALVGWLALRWIRGSYERKRLSDQSITLDAIFLSFAIVHSFDLAFEGLAWLLSGVVAFAVYRGVAWAGFFLLNRTASPTRESPKLLLLRVFSLGRPSERLFDKLATHWRHAGSIQLIAGPDLATTTVEPHEFLDFLSGRLARRFIGEPETLERRISEMDVKPDRDRRFRVNDFFCYEDTWKTVLSRLVSESDAVLMDLRGFSPQNAGCVFEIDELINVVPLEKVVFVVDDTTDEQFLRQTVQGSWNRMRPTSPNRPSTSGQVQLFRFTGSRNGELQQLLHTLAIAARAELREQPTSKLTPRLDTSTLRDVP